MLTVGSLFSGIGGIDLGLERAGMKVLWQVEIDAWCRAVLAKHWPDVERFDDVRSVGAGSLRAVDLVAGGFPCQDISHAGRGAGISGSRSGLWGDFARIIGDLRPRYVLVENVPALKSRGLEVVLADLAALGYDAEWDCIPAQAVSAPHRRDRVWIVAYPRGARRREDARGAYGDEASDEGRAATDDHELDRDGESDRTRDLADSDTERLQERGLHEVGREEIPDLAGGGWSDESLADTDRGGWAGRFGELGTPGRGELADGGQWATEPDVGRVAHGVPNRVDRLRGLGNAVVPQVVEWIGRRIVEAEAQSGVS